MANVHLPPLAGGAVVPMESRTPLPVAMRCAGRVLLASEVDKIPCVEKKIYIQIHIWNIYIYIYIYIY